VEVPSEGEVVTKAVPAAGKIQWGTTSDEYYAQVDAEILVESLEWDWEGKAGQPRPFDQDTAAKRLHDFRIRPPSSVLTNILIWQHNVNGLFY